MDRSRRFGAVAGVWLAALFASASPVVGQVPFSPPPAVSFPVNHDLSPRLRDIPPIPPAAVQAPRVIPRQPRPTPQGLQRPAVKGPSSGATTPAAPAATNMPAPTQNFDGVNNVDSVLPPDPNGDVGPNHYVQWVNLSFAIYAKSGTRLYGPAAGNTLWAGFGGPCESQNDGDPIALYDRLADRWLMSQLAVPNFPAGPFYQCIAVSQTPDPTGAYYRYAFLISDTKLNDYPKFGVWPDAYYLAINQFDEISLTAAGQGVVAFERAKMLAGDPAAAMVYFDLFSVDPTLGGMLPSHLNGPPPPAGSPNYFVQVDDDAWGYAPDQLQVWQFHVDWADPASSTFTRAALLPAAPFDSSMCGYAPNCIPQRGTGIKLDALSDRLMYRLQYRHFGAYDTLVVNHTVDVGGDHAGIRWYEIRRVDGALSIFQQGTYAPDAAHRWMGSIAMDGAGNIALGFSASSNTLYPAIRYVGRLTGDPLGTLPQGETTLKAGGGSQTHPSGRWGDYSTLSVDPTDDCTFWYTQEYYAATRSFSWRTRIGSFKFPSCAPTATGADLSIALTDAPDPVFAGSTLTYTITVTNNGSQSASGVTVTDPLPAGASFVSASSAQGSCAGTTTITCALGALALGARATVTLVVTPTVGGAFSNTVSVAGNEADPNPADNSATAVTTVIVPNPVPVVSTLSPSTTAAGSAPLTLTVNGSDFIASSVVRWSGADRTTSFVSPSQLEAAILASDVTTAGTAQVTVFNPAPGGGTSSALTFTITPVLPGNETLSASPTTIAAGGTLTATWSGIATPTATDWIGLYLPTSADGGYLAYRYTTGYTSGTVPFVLPATLAPGTYELRLFANNSLTRLAVSNPFTVPAPPSLAVSPTTVAPGDSVTATWSGVPTPTATDWLGLFTPGSADTASLTARQYTTGAASGSLPFPIPASLAPGTYELRLFASDTLTRLAVSNAFTVATGGPVTLSVSPTTLAAGGTLTATWSGIATPTAADWLGLYAPGAPDGSYISYRYTTGEASGSVPFTLPASLPPGTYELRLFANNSLTRLAVSNAFTVPEPPTLSVSPTTVAPGDSVTATWSGVPTPTATDWLGLFTPGSADTASLTARQYTTGAASGSLPFPIPASLAPGTYELRLFTNDTLTRLAVSNAFTVSAPAGPVTLSASPTTLAAGGTLTATWSGIATPTATDWIGLYLPTSADGGYLAYRYTTGTASGSVPFTLPASLPPGTYELRLFANNSLTRLAVSNAFTVAP